MGCIFPCFWMIVAFSSFSFSGFGFLLSDFWKPEYVSYCSCHESDSNALSLTSQVLKEILERLHLFHRMQWESNFINVQSLFVDTSRNGMLLDTRAIVANFLPRYTKWKLTGLSITKTAVDLSKSIARKDRSWARCHCQISHNLDCFWGLFFFLAVCKNWFIVPFFSEWKFNFFILDKAWQENRNCCQG